MTPSLAFLALGALLFVALGVKPGLGPFIKGLTYSGVAAFAGLWAFRARARARPEAIPGLEAVALTTACAAGLVLLFQNVLVHDALWYYSYLRSALVDHDLDLFEEFVLRNPNGMYLPPPGTPVFHLGTSLLQAPVAWLIRPLALLLGRAGVLPGGDGYGPLEVGAATWSSMMLAVGGVVLTHRLARRFSGGPASSIAQLALLYASPLAFFAFVWPGYPHAATVFLGGVFLLVWAGSEGREGRSRPLLLGLLAGGLALVHPQDILYLALPLLDLLVELPEKRWARTLHAAACLAGGAAVGFAPQMAAWAATSGSPLPHVYAEIGDPFLWTHPALLDVLFSGYNGLFTWTPLCAIGASGLFLLRREHPRVFRGLLLLVLLEWWAIASYGYWWGGASFGSRYFLSAYPALGVGLAMVLCRVGKRVGLLIAGLSVVPFVFWNLLLMAQFRLEWIPHNQRPDFGSILVRQVFEAPSMLGRGLIGVFHWNQVLVVEQLRAAVDSGSFMRALGIFVGTGGLVALMAIWVAYLSTGSPFSGARDRAVSSRFGRASLLGLAAAVFATVTVLVVAHDDDRRRLLAETSTLPRDVEPARTVRLPLTPRRDGPTGDQPTAVVAPASAEHHDGESLTIDLVSFLRAGASRRKGEVVAWLSPRGQGCGLLSYPIRAGYETAETSPDREETRESMRHDVEQADVIQSWWQHDLSRRYYWGHAYLASWDLPMTCRPDKVTIRTTPGAGILELRQLVLSASLSENP